MHAGRKPASGPLARHACLLAGDRPIFRGELIAVKPWRLRTAPKFGRRRNLQRPRVRRRLRSLDEVEPRSGCLRIHRDHCPNARAADAYKGLIVHCNPLWLMSNRIMAIQLNCMQIEKARPLRIALYSRSRRSSSPLGRKPLLGTSRLKLDCARLWREPADAELRDALALESGLGINKRQWTTLLCESEDTLP